MKNITLSFLLLWGTLVFGSATTSKQIDSFNATGGTAIAVPSSGIWQVNTGGTGASTLTSNNVILGNGTSAVQFVAPGTSGNVLTSNGTTWTSAAATGGTGPRSQIVLNTGNGFGSTNTVIQRFSTTQSSTGSNITLNQSSTNGDNFTLNAAGVYTTCINNGRSPSGTFGISINSNQLTTNITTITAANRLCETWCTAGEICGCCATFIGATNDVIRSHTDNGSGYLTSAEVKFSITQVSN